MIITKEALKQARALAQGKDWLRTRKHLGIPHPTTTRLEDISSKYKEMMANDEVVTTLKGVSVFPDVSLNQTLVVWRRFIHTVVNSFGDRKVARRLKGHSDWRDDITNPFFDYMDDWYPIHLLHDRCHLLHGKNNSLFYAWAVDAFVAMADNYSMQFCIVWGPHWRKLSGDFGTVLIRYTINNKMKTVPLRSSLLFPIHAYLEVLEAGYVTASNRSGILKIKT